MCGEKLALPKTRRSSWGSPPRVRGKGFCLPLALYGLRITPACAGKSASDDWCGPGWEDHPRVCGEKLVLRPGVPKDEGSPPRVRGKGVRNASRSNSARITPACAGKSRIHCQPYGYSGDHPRVCGEKALSIVTLAAKSGSPPRVRGKALKVFALLRFFRITPACAGKSRQESLCRLES